MPRYRFDDIAINSIEKVKAGDIDITKYVGLEHLESGSLIVSRWGSKVPIAGDKLLMREGDVLLGKRNAYLRRAAIAPHDGAFSAHGMVLRPREDIVCREFFPFLISSDCFFDEAIRISVGSLSPTINWSDLRKLEFNLPDMDKQRKLAELLWGMVEAKEAYRELLRQTDELVKARFVEMFGDLECNTKTYPVKKFNEVATYWNGLTFKPIDVTQDGSGTLVLRSSNIQDGKLSFKDNVRVSCPIKDKLFVKENDILMCSRNGSAALVGKTALIGKLDELMTFGAFMMIIRSNLYPYLRTFFDMPVFRRQIFTGTSTINQITGKMLNEIRIPVPDMELITRYKNFTEQADNAKYELTQAMNNLDVLYKRILNQELGA